MRCFAVMLGLGLALGAPAADLRLAWTASPTPDPTLAYNLYWASSPTAPWVLYATTTALTITVTNLVPASYRFQVTATNLWGESPPSNVVSTPPGKPSPVTITIQR